MSGGYDVPSARIAANDAREWPRADVRRKTKRRQPLIETYMDQREGGLVFSLPLFRI